MTNYCKSNVRRVINYTNHEPVNKYDLWLSENLRYNENGDLEYDNTGLPACDLILKIFRNGRWEPIVGYNTASANKINIVSGVPYAATGRTGYSLNHLPLFRNPSDSPDELFDAGTLGQAIHDYVTYEEWQTILGDSNFYNAWNTQISHINIPLATHQKVGGIKCQTDNTDLDYRGLPVVFGGPNAGLTYGGNTPSGFTLYGDLLAYNPNNAFLYIPGWALNDWLQDPTGNGTPLPFPIDPGSIVIALNTLLKNTSSIGWRVITTLSNPSISPDIWGVDTGNAGKYLRIKQLEEWPTIPPGETAPTGGWNQSNNVMEWVDGPSYTGNNLIRVNGQYIEIDTTTSPPSNGDVIIYDSGEVKWSASPGGATYNAGVGINISETNYISQNITKATPGASGTIYNIQIDWASQRDLFTIKYNLGQDENISLYQVIDFGDVDNLNSQVDYTITEIPFNANPVYFILRSVKSITVAQNQEVINKPDPVAVLSLEGVLVTIQFGIVKFEEITLDA